MAPSRSDGKNGDIDDAAGARSNRQSEAVSQDLIKKRPFVRASFWKEVQVRVRNEKLKGCLCSATAAKLKKADVH